ncbi:MAG: hypothetical protein ACREEB_13175, partial [Caulobacteraceae bacterium]
MNTSALILALLLTSCGSELAYAQNAPLSGLATRGVVQSSDLIPIMPAGGAQLEQTTVGDLLAGAGTGDGTVTSVGLTMPAELSCSGSPVTTSGVIACALATETVNTVFAGPTSGGAAAPTFRALVTADLPPIDFSFLTGSADCGQLPALTGDVTTSGCAATLATSGVTAGSYTQANITVDAKGRITAASSAPAAAIIGTGGTLYVNASTGSDSNDCTSSGAPCLTFAHALSLIPIIVSGAYTINVADGTYAECLEIQGFVSPFGSTYLTVDGDAGTPTNVKFTGQCSFPAIGTQTAGALISSAVPVLIENLEINPSSASTFGLIDTQGASYVTFENGTITGSLTNGIGSFHGANVGLDGVVTISGWTGFGSFSGLHGSVNHAGGLGMLTLSLI